MAEPTEKKKKRARRNFAKELERVETYIETVIRIKERDALSSDSVTSELVAYRDVLDFIQGGAK